MWTFLFYLTETQGTPMGLSDRNDCLYNRCYNGGTCYDLYKRFKCVCVPGYDGNHCQNKSKELSHFHGLGSFYWDGILHLHLYIALLNTREVNSVFCMNWWKKSSSNRFPNLYLLIEERKWSRKFTKSNCIFDWKIRLVQMLLFGWKLHKKKLKKSQHFILGALQTNHQENRALFFSQSILFTVKRTP